MTNDQKMAIGIFCCVGLLFICIGVLFLIPVRFNRRCRRSAVRKMGIVIGYEVVERQDEGTRYDPVVVFRDDTGFENTAAVRGTRDRTFEPGQTVMVLHHPQYPRYAMIAELDGYREHELFAIMALVTGGLTFLMGLAIWVLRIPVNRA